MVFHLYSDRSPGKAWVACCSGDTILRESALTQTRLRSIEATSDCRERERLPRVPGRGRHAGRVRERAWSAPS